MKPQDRLIVALDVPSVEEASSLVQKLGDSIHFYKIGYHLGFSGGLDLARQLISQNKKVFLDFKLHDIGNTVEAGVLSLAQMGASLVTVHAYPQTMQAAMRGKQKAGVQGDKLKVIAVTVLTSYDDKNVKELGFDMPVTELVHKRAEQALHYGVDGVVASASEASMLRKIMGPDKLIVTPGIRLADDSNDDQKRIMTPAQALEKGADYLVIGRPITAADNPEHAARAFLKNLV